MKHKGKRAVLILVTLLLAVYPLGLVRAEADTIYESSSTQTVTSGVTLENVTKFTSDGWLNIKILRVDLTDRYIKVDSIINPESITKLTPVNALASANGAVAAVNGSFFNPTGPGAGYPDGPIMEAGKVISAYSEYNKYSSVMASFSIDELNRVFYEYWKSDISIKGSSGDPITISQYNNPSRLDYTDYTILDKKWGTISIGCTPNYPDITEMVVDNGKVVEIRQGLPAAEIPVNGYVVVTRQAGSAALFRDFKSGDDVKLDISTAPDWKNFTMSATGGSILVRDGKIPSSFSFNTAYISKKQPRTAVGSSRDGKELILVTVDGRQNLSIGMTQQEIAEYMLKLGAYNALNLDGGGSTTMAARKAGTQDMEIVNSPSDGIPRSISNAIGIFSLAPPSRLEGLIIDTEDSNVFVDTSRAFTVRGYDRYFNPVEINPDQVDWSVSGIKGTFDGNILHPLSVGEAVVTAKVGSAKGTISVSSLSSPVRLQIGERLVKLALNQSKTFSVTGVNKNGYSAKINPADVEWKVSENIGGVSGNTFTASAMGTGYVDAAVGGTHAYSAISVASGATQVIDAFEAPNADFLSYPDTVKGSYSISAFQRHTGNTSGRLDYSFSASEETEAAYAVLAGGGLSLKDVARLGVWVYNDHVNSNWVRAEIVDSSGKKSLVGITRVMDWTGWKYLEMPLDGISSPSALTRLYLAKVNPVPDKGSVFFDDITIIRNDFPAVDMTKVPQDTVPADEANMAVTYEPSADSFRFAVLGTTRDPQNPLESLLQAGLADKINKYIDAAAFVGKSTNPAVFGIAGKPVISTGMGYNAIDIKDSRLIQLDMSAGSLRLSGKNQWRWFLDQLSYFRGDNIFIFLSGAPDGFSDTMEADLFKKTLTDYRQSSHKNIWVFYRGNGNTSYMERGVKYITSAGYEAPGVSPDNLDAADYVLVTVKGNVVSFEFKPIV